MLKALALPAIKLLMKLHNFSYHAVGRLAIRVDGGRLHPKHRIMDYHRFFMDRVRPNDVVLDVGCSNAALAVDVATRCRRLIGIELSEASVRQARARVEKAGVTNCTFIVGDVMDTELPEKIDCVVLSNVLEHIDKRVPLLQRLAKISPRLLIRVPVIDRDWITLYKKELGVEYRLDQTHFIEYTLDELHRELTAGGWKMVEHIRVFGEIWGTCERTNA
jgi:2-polyprenyl-3-methyl-5-hydroxy-6-metoxy-1,4-benzoquinol methylase